MNVLEIRIDLREIKERLSFFWDTEKEDFWNDGITAYFFGEDFIPRGTHTECSVSFGLVSEPTEMDSNMITVPAKKGIPITFNEDIDKQIVKAIYAGIHKFNPEYKSYQFKIKYFYSKSIYLK